MCVASTSARRSSGLHVMPLHTRVGPIFSSMLDEFFQIRISGLRQQLHAGSITKSPDGRTAGEQLAAARKRVLQLVAGVGTPAFQALLEPLSGLVPPPSVRDALLQIAIDLAAGRARALGHPERADRIEAELGR